VPGRLDPMSFHDREKQSVTLLSLNQICRHIIAARIYWSGGLQARRTHTTLSHYDHIDRSCTMMADRVTGVTGQACTAVSQSHWEAVGRCVGQHQKIKRALTILSIGAMRRRVETYRVLIRTTSRNTISAYTPPGHHWLEPGALVVRRLADTTDTRRSILKVTTESNA